MQKQLNEMRYELSGLQTRLDAQDRLGAAQQNTTSQQQDQGLHEGAPNLFAYISFGGFWEAFSTVRGNDNCGIDRNLDFFHSQACLSLLKNIL
jgi:hypothetical protein